MFAVLEWVDGFGNDTRVAGIYPTLDEAIVYDENDRWIEFEFGEVNFDWYEANKFEHIEDE